MGSLLAFLLVLFSFAAELSQSAKSPVNICTNSITANVSKFMHAQDDWEVYSAQVSSSGLPAHYTGPAVKNATYIPERRHLLSVARPDFLQGGSLAKVSIVQDSPQGRAQGLNLEYMLMLEPDNLVYNFRKQAGLDAPGSPYGGWEAPDKDLRGHFVGHYLSASAFAWSYSRNTTLYNNMNKVVGALAECQEKIGSGYLSAFPEELFDKFEMLEPVWAPYYTIHKIMAGLLDQFVHANNSNAFKVLLWMVQYFSQRVNNYIAKYSIESHYQALNEEFGGMNDVLYSLYSITGNPEHLKLAHLFDKPCFLGLLALEADSISGFHANTHLPVIVGAENRYEVVGDDIYRSLSEYFMKMVNSSHLYATGGTSVHEFWSDPNRLATTLSTTETEETCATYNMLKISRNLFRWTRRVDHADYYEKAMVNGIMSVQRGEPGVMIYMLPLKAGASKAESQEGWGTPFDTMWCCYGTAMESFAKLGDSIYFLDNPVKAKDASSDPVPGLYIIQYVSSTLVWDTIGLKVQQSVQELTSYDPVLRMDLEFTEADTMSHKNVQAILNVRVPSWTTKDCQAMLNGASQDISPGTFLSIQRAWKAGDKLSFSFPATIRVEHILDDRSEYAAMNAVFFGPYLLAGMSSGDYIMTPPQQQDAVVSSLPETWILPVDPSNNDMLFSFHLEALGNGIMLGHQNESVVTGRANITGTDWDFFSTFRVIPSITECGGIEDGCFNSTDGDDGSSTMTMSMGDNSTSLSDQLIGRLVSLELVDQPKQFIAHNGIKVDLVVRDMDELIGTTAGSAVFKMVRGLSNMSDTVSLEAAGIPGCYVHAGAALDENVQLKCMPLDTTQLDEFSQLTSFMVHRGSASYHPLSFIAQASNRAYLMFPLADYRDEHYTVYFDMQ